MLFKASAVKEQSGTSVKANARLYHQGRFMIVFYGEFRLCYQREILVRLSAHSKLGLLQVEPQGSVRLGASTVPVGCPRGVRFAGGWSSSGQSVNGTVNSQISQVL